MMMVIVVVVVVKAEKLHDWKMKAYTYEHHIWYDLLTPHRRRD